MLPLLRLLPVGGVCIAFLALLLGFSVPGATYSRALYEPQMRGTLLRTDVHPDWKQLLILAAARRDQEIGQVNVLIGAPRGWRGPNSRFAGLPSERGDADPDDATGSIIQSPGVTLPLDIGETSSTELPVVKPEEQAPIKKPERAKPQQEGKRAAPRRVRNVAKPDETPSFDIFGITRPRGLNGTSN